MEAYKFETIVLEDGVIKIPEISKFANRSVEIIIVIKKPNKNSITNIPRYHVIRAKRRNWPCVSIAYDTFSISHIYG